MRFSNIKIFIDSKFVLGLYFNSPAMLQFYFDFSLWLLGKGQFNL